MMMMKMVLFSDMETTRSISSICFIILIVSKIPRNPGEFPIVAVEAT